MCHRPGDGDSTLPKTMMYPVVEKGRDGIAEEWGQEDQRDYGVGDAVVLFELDTNEHVN
jgi:hypothetical protein